MKKLFLLLFVTAGLFNLVQAQNAIVGTGFSTGWGSTCSPTSSVDYFNFVGSAGTSYTSGDLTPKATGDQYWRLAINWSNTYYQISTGADLAVSPGTKNSSTVSCTSTGAWFRNVSALTNRYVFKTLNAGTAPTGTWVFVELSGASATVNWVSQSPSSPTVNDAVTITATMSTVLPTGQGVYLRYTTDNWTTSSVASMSGSGTIYSTSIASQPLNTTVKYYVFTSGSGLTIAPADADLYTINWNAGGINGGGNYLYTGTAAPATTLAQSFLFDFGPIATDLTNGDLTTGADNNGKYWNNITIKATTDAAVSLVNTANNSTTYSLAITANGFISNGKLNGALRSPYASQFMAAGSDPELAIGTATEDYFYTGYGSSPAFRLQGLNPNKLYKFKIFGSRNGSVLRTSQYAIAGAASTSGTLNTSTVAGFGTGYTPASYSADGDNSYKLTSQTGYTTATTHYGNNSNTYVTGLVYPNASGQITLTLTSTISGTNAYMNCMKMEEYKAAQSITFGTLSGKTTSDVDFAPGATASSLLTVSYASSNTAVATILSGKIHIVGAGTTTITASQDGDGTYDAATNVTQTLTVSAASLTAQTITFDALSAKTVGGATFNLAATASSHLTVSYSSSNTAVATVSGSTVTIVGAGTTDITASQAGDGTYAAAANVVQTLTVNKQNQSITFNVLNAKSDADGTFTVSPTSTSGLSVTLSSSNTNVALVSANTITIVGAGASIITASQAGDATYNAATNVQQTLTVSSAMSLAQSLFFDFGPRDGSNGDETVNPDSNGNYWNNISTASGGLAIGTATPAFTTLLTSTNTISGFSLAFTSDGFIANGKLNGGLLTPFASQLGSNSELAITNATEDYIYTTATANGPVITFSGLNSSKKYKFKIFGSRNVIADRSTQYTIQGAGSASLGILQSSTTAGLGGTVYIGQNVPYPGNLNVKYAISAVDTLTKSVMYYGNNSTVYSSGLIQPNNSGNISITTISTTPLSAFAYINCMKMEEYSGVSTEISSNENSNIDVFPAIFENSVTVVGAKKCIELYTITGQKIKNEASKSTMILDTALLPKGFYIITVDSKSSFKIVKK